MIVRNLGIVGISLLLIGCQTTDNGSGTTGSERYSGTRVSERAVVNGINCMPSEMTVNVSGNTARGSLSYNNARLTGNVAGSGEIRLTGSIGRWNYTFDGRRTASGFSGTWSEAASGCRGTWSVASR